jgi:uncharacterized delta-60 repeat protein
MNFPHTSNQPRLLNLLKILIILIFSIQIYSSAIFSQTKQTVQDNGVDLSFDPKLRNPSNITTAKQFDGKLLVYGNVDEINGEPLGKRGEPKLLRFNENGSIDNTLNFDLTKLQRAHLYYSASIFTTQSGHIFLIGDSYSSPTVKLNSDGSIDNSFRYNPAYYKHIAKIIERNDGKFLFFGNFSVPLSEEPLKEVTRDVELIDANGNVDESFRTFAGKVSSAESVTNAILLSDGKIIITGTFSEFNNDFGTIFPRNGLAKLNADGSLDESFNPNINKPYYRIFEILPASNNQFYIFGEFNKVNFDERKSIARLNSDGTTDASFNYITSENAFLNSFTLQNDGKLIVSKIVRPILFNAIVKVKNIRLTVNGEVDSSFISPEISVGKNYNAFRIIISDSNNNVIITNCLGKINGKTRLGLARLQPNGVLDESYVRNLTSTQMYSGLGSKSLVESVAVQSDGKIIVAGNFSVLNGEWIGVNDETSTEGNYAVRLNTDGSLDKVFDLHNFSGGLNRIVRIDYQGRIIFCSTGKLWRFNSDGTPDTTFVSYFNVSTFGVVKLFPLPNGKIVFTAYYRDHSPLVRLNENGSYDESFNYPAYQVFPPGGYDTSQFTVQDDGKMIFGGNRNRWGNSDVKLLPRLLLDGTIDNNFDLAPFPDDKYMSVERIAAKNGKIYVSAKLQDYYRKSLYRLNNNGIIEKDFNVTAREMLVQPDDKIIVIGRYLSKNLSQLRKNEKRSNLLANNLSQAYSLYRMDQNGIADKSFSFFSRGGSAFINGNYNPIEMALQPDGNLIVIGDFDNVNGVRRVGIVRLKMN